MYLFRVYPMLITDAQLDSESKTSNQDVRPQILWAGYFCVPDLSSVPQDLISMDQKSSNISSDRILVVPGLNTLPDLDAVAPVVSSYF